MTPEEHLAEADRLVDEAATMPMDEAQPHLTFAHFHIELAKTAAALGVREDLGRFVDLGTEEARRRDAALTAAALASPPPR